MKKLFTLFCFIAITCAGFSQDFDLASIIKPGVKLVYEVDANGKTYNFIVTIMDKKGSSFAWEMTDPVNISGTIIHTDKALKSGTVMYNYFGEGTKKLDDKTLSVWLSKKVFDNMESSAGQPMKIYMYGADSPGIEMGTFTGALNNEILVDGETKTISEELVKPLVKDGNDIVPDDDQGEFFTFYPNADFPVILRMNAGFSLALKEVRTK